MLRIQRSYIIKSIQRKVELALSMYLYRYWVVLPLRYEISKNSDQRFWLAEVEKLSPGFIKLSVSNIYRRVLRKVSITKFEEFVGYFDFWVKPQWAEKSIRKLSIGIDLYSRSIVHCSEGFRLVIMLRTWEHVLKGGYIDKGGFFSKGRLKTYAETMLSLPRARKTLPT